MAEEHAEKKHSGRHHGFHTTTVRHHKDGSHTIHHQHEDPEKSVEHAVPDHDAMMDSMHEHLSPDMAGAGGEGGAEEAMEAGAAGAPAV